MGPAQPRAHLVSVPIRFSSVRPLTDRHHCDTVLCCSAVCSTAWRENVPPTAPPITGIPLETENASVVVTATAARTSRRRVLINLLVIMVAAFLQICVPRRLRPLRPSHAKGMQQSTRGGCAGRDRYQGERACRLTCRCHACLFEILVSRCSNTSREPPHIARASSAASKAHC